MPSPSSGSALRALTPSVPAPALPAPSALMATADRHLRLAVHQRALARALEDARNAARHGTMGKTG